MSEIKQKTVRFKNHRITGGIVEELVDNTEIDCETGEEIGCFEWKRTDIKIGAKVMLVSERNISTYDESEFVLVFNAPDGIPGNDNSDIKRFHGWRGTTCDIEVVAHGLRKIIKISELKNSDISVTVGQDICPDRREFECVLNEENNKFEV